MQDRCDELHEISRQIPTYTSWTTGALGEAFNRFREIILELVQSSEYINYKWLAEYCPQLGTKIQLMMDEKRFDKQSALYNNLTFELQCAVDVLLGRIGCRDNHDWENLISYKVVEYEGY